MMKAEQMAATRITPDFYSLNLQLPAIRAYTGRPIPQLEKNLIHRGGKLEHQQTFRHT